MKLFKGSWRGVVILSCRIALSGFLGVACFSIVGQAGDQEKINEKAHVCHDPL